MATLREVITGTPALAGLTYPEIAEFLNEAPLVDNPTPQGDVPAPVSLKALLTLVPAAEMAKIYHMAGYVDDLRRALDANDHEYMGALLQIALAEGAISQGTAAALGPLLTATEPDPAWQEQIAGPARWAAAGLAGPVSPADVQAALHGGG